MAEYLTTDTELTSIADAIRTKGGTSAPLVYPQGFIDAIMALPGGGGSSNYTVTVSLTNPRNSSQFVSCDIYEALSNDEWGAGEYLDAIISADGTKTIRLSSSVYGLNINVHGTSVSIPTSGISTTGGVTFKQVDGEIVIFEVTGDGTITLDSIDYND